ncbi:MAG: UTP--glucose-1-phosphate uridylyltransferase [Pseudomonadota bacterium]|nr:UTP--glucose-1-phosphate uridylyltransferase [Pseudomonadota bacterium]
MTDSVTTAVFPVAGRGTRFLPATKAVPKEMLPVVDKPLIQYAVDEAIDAGVTKFIFITHSSKGAIEDHFAEDTALTAALDDAGKQNLVASIQNNLPEGATFEYVFQHEPLGLGHAVLCAKEAVADESFYVHLPDDLILSSKGCLSQLNDHYQAHGSSVIAVEEIPGEKTLSYGIAAVDPSYKINEIIEKPNPEDAPSNLGVVGRYLLTPEIFSVLENIGKGSGGEIQLTDGIAELMKKQSVYALPFDGKRYDCGDKLGYLKANIDFALERKELKQGLRQHLRSIK